MCMQSVFCVCSHMSVLLFSTLLSFLTFPPSFKNFLKIHYFQKVVKMQFSGRTRKKLRLAGDQRNACYPHSLQFYLQPPSENISLIEFENLAVDRLKCKWHLNSNVCILGKRSYHLWQWMKAVHLLNFRWEFVILFRWQGLSDEECNSVLCWNCTYYGERGGEEGRGERERSHTSSSPLLW